MDKYYDRNNIYFMYTKNNISNIYLIYQDNNIAYDIFSECIVGNIKDLFELDEFVVAPIDILLYHLEDLECLHRNYTAYEKKQRLEGKMAPNIYKRLKYIYNLSELKAMLIIINTNNEINILDTVKLYKDYFLNRKKDSVLRIYFKHQ